MLSTIWLYAKDPAITARFYREQLGLPQLSSEDDEHFDVGGVRLSIHPQKEGEPPTGSDCFLVFLAEDNNERTYVELKRRSVNFVGPIQDEPFGRLAGFRATDNKPLYIWEPSMRESEKFSRRCKPGGTLRAGSKPHTHFRDSTFHELAVRRALCLVRGFLFLFCMLLLSWNLLLLLLLNRHHSDYDG